MLSGGFSTLAQLSSHHTQQGVLLYPPGLAIGTVQLMIWSRAGEGKPALHGSILSWSSHPDLKVLDMDRNLDERSPMPSPVLLVQLC